MMAGLLEDPRQQGLLALGLGLLNSRGSFGQGLGQAGMQAMDVMRQATMDKQRREQMAQAKQMQDFQFQQAQMQAAQQQAQAAKQADGERARGGYLNSIDPNAGPAMAFNPVSAMRAGLNASEIEQLGPKAGAKPLVVGDTVLDPVTMKPMWSAPAKPEARPELAKLISLRDSFPPGDQNRRLVESAISKAATHAPAPSATVINQGQKGFDNSLKLRGDFRSEPVYKAHQEMQSAYSQIQQSLKQASPAGDLAGATKIMKLLDPGSVVRESELGMAMAASGLLDRASNYASMVMSGQKLTPTQRKDFQKLADALYGESVKQYNNKRGEYEGIAKRNMLNVEDILGNASAAPAGGVVDFGSLK